MRRPYLRFGILLIMVVALGGCQNIDRQTRTGAGATDVREADRLRQLTQAHEALLELRNEFSVGGGLGLWTDEQSLSARILWQQTPDALDLALEGPMGLGKMHLLEADGLAVLTRGEQLVAQGARADQVLQQGLGLQAPVPLQQLMFWIRGLPGDAVSAKRDKQGKLSSLQFKDEQGIHWQARFRRYENWDGAQVPSLITASGGPYSVRVVLKNWQYLTSITAPDTPKSNNRLPIPGR